MTLKTKSKIYVAIAIFICVYVYTLYGSALQIAAFVPFWIYVVWFSEHYSELIHRSKKYKALEITVALMVSGSLTIMAIIKHI